MTNSMMTSSSCKQKPFLIEDRKPLMLKDYLRDDLSSCSSSGFKSFPRKQCCTTVRFLLEIDLKTKQQQRQQKQIFKRSMSSKAASTTISAFQKASFAVINAVKLLPFPSSNSAIKSASPSRNRKALFLTRSFSRKLFKKRFWRKTADHDSYNCQDGNHEVRRWKLFREFLEEQDKPSDQIPSRMSTSSSSNSNSNIWTTESEFTVDTSGNSNSGSGNDAVESSSSKDLIDTVSGSVGVSVGQDSIKNRKEWPNEDEKEQFSPVSVLDCPFQDEDDEISSPFQRSLARMEGTKRKLMQKIKRFESLALLEPVDLEKRIALAEFEDESFESPRQHCSLSIHGENDNNFKKNTEASGTEEKDAQELLKLAEATIASNCSLPVDSLLLDFFKEKIVDNNASRNMIRGHKEFEKELELVQDWINGHPKEMFLGWEVKDSRHVYTNCMDNSGKWKNMDEEKEEIGSELEFEIFNSLVDEVLFEMF